MSPKSERSDTSSGSPSAGEVVLALRALRHGGYDDASRALELGPIVAASLAALLVALRWGAVMVGLGWAVTQADSGDFGVVFTLSVCIFLASWRTVRPIRLGDRSAIQSFLSLSDVIILASATGLSEGLNSPFVGCVLVAVAIVAFGWGLNRGLLAAFVGLVGAAAVSVATTENGSLGLDPLAVTALAAAAIFPGIAQFRLLDLEDRRRSLFDQREALNETNELLSALNDLARTLPSSLDLADVLKTTRQQLTEQFDADRIAMLTVEDGIWSVSAQRGFDLPPTMTVDNLPAPLGLAYASSEPLYVEDLRKIGTRHGFGVYTRLIVKGVDAGLLVIEREGESFGEDFSPDYMRGIAEVVALNIANARAFGRLRSLAATEERARIARDLHDRLGQWLTYIGLELERINHEQEEPSLDLKQLHEDTQGAIAELRDTLMELRASVGPGRPLGVLLGEVVDRVRKRSSFEIHLSVPGPKAPQLGRVVENEFLRIAQEALTNVEKHAMATEVTVAWQVVSGRGTLTISDNGRGFDTSKGTRGDAYGLVGMRERAASVGAILEVSSEPDQGTVITVLTSQPTGALS